MPRIIGATNPFILPEGALCLSRSGWSSKTEEVQIGLQTGLSMSRALEILWEEHKGLLGVGDLVFAQTTTQPTPTGYVVFIPAP